MPLTYPKPSVLKEIADTCGTPVMIYDEDAVRNTMKEYVTNFKSDMFETNVLYASKAFLCKAIAKAAAEEGLHFDAVSGGEIFCRKKYISMETTKHHGK